MKLTKNQWLKLTILRAFIAIFALLLLSSCTSTEDKLNELAHTAAEYGYYEALAGSSKDEMHKKLSEAIGS